MVCSVRNIKYFKIISYIFVSNKGKVKEADNHMYPPKIYSPIYITDSMLGINSNTSGYATHRKSAEHIDGKKDPPGAPSLSESDSSSKAGEAISFSSDCDEVNAENRKHFNNIAFEIDINPKKQEQEQVSQRNEETNSNTSLSNLKPKIKIAKSKKNSARCASARHSHIKDLTILNSLESKFKKINTVINALEKNFSGSRYFDKVAENIVNCYDLNNKCLRIKEKHRIILETLDQSTISLFKHTDQVFTLARSLNRKDDLRPNLFPIARDLNLLENIYHFKFYDNLGKILLKNIHFGRLVYVHDFSLVQKIKYFHLLNNNSSDESQKNGKRVLKLLNLKNEI
jgi:hypothetical protein